MLSTRSLRRHSLVVVFIAVVLVVGGCLFGPTKPERTGEFEFCRVALQSYFIFQQDLPEDLYQYETPEALYASVHEPYTAYNDPSEAQYILSLLTTSSVGMGIYLEQVPSGYCIRAVFPNSPAQAAGLQKGDTIVAIEGMPIVGTSQQDLQVFFHGSPGDRKELEIRRNTTALHITVVLGPFKAPSVITDTLDSVTAYIALTVFSDSTNTAGGSAEEFSRALENTHWAPYTILDLRDNGGGILEQCIAITSEFVPEGTDLVIARERYYDLGWRRHQTRQTPWRASARGRAIGRRFFVLVDKYTASASEVVVAALKVHRSDDITIVGTTTYGKGRGQRIWLTPEAGLARVTYSTLTPVSGAPYDQVGIVPDIQTNTDALDFALEEIRREAGMGKPSARSAARLEARCRAVEAAARATRAGKAHVPLCITREQDPPY